MQTIRAGEPREVLALIPFRLGFQPSDSAAAVSLRAPRGRVGLVVRVDLADLADPVEGPQVARGMIALLGRDRAVRTLLAVYTDDDPRGRDPRVARAIAHYREAAVAAFGDCEEWAVTRTGFLNLACDGPCCPPGGRPLAGLASTQVSARMVLEGHTVAASRDDLVRFPAVGPERRRTVARARRRWERAGREAAAEGTAALGAWRERGLAAFRAGLAAAAHGFPDGTRVPWGRLEAALDDRRVRDAVLVACLTGDGLAEASVYGATTDPDVDARIGAALRRVISAEEATLPTPDAQVAERVLELVVAQGRREGGAPALTLLAWLAWWRGEGSRARMLLERALAHDEEYRLAVLLARMLEAGTGPGWTRREHVGADPGGRG